MVRHFNTSITEDAARILGSKAGEFLTEEVQGLVAVIPIQRFSNIVKSNLGTNTTSSTIYTTPSDKDFYLTAASLGFAKDATATATAVTLEVTVEGVAQNILVLPTVTLTADARAVANNYPIPIKLDRGSAITAKASAGVATILIRAAIQGYTVETTKGT